MDAAKARGIVVTNTPDVLNDATADVAMLCLLGAARRGAEGDRLVRAGEWIRWHSTMLLGVHMTGKRLGIFGMGRIRASGGAAGARLRHGDPLLQPEPPRAGTRRRRSLARHPGIAARGERVPVDQRASSPETRKFLNAERIALLPDGAVVVNTARGDLVDDDALIDALRSGKVAAAGLDVFAGEPNLDPRYCELDNTFLLPHIGSASHETRDAMGYCCLDNLDAFFAGRRCPNAL